MTDNPTPPDYELADRIALTQPSQVKALGNPVRNTILGLLHERAATVTELATALERPKSTVAHHVKVLAEAGLVQVVRTRRVRAIEERFYGRTARMFYVTLEPSTRARSRLGISTTSKSPPASRPQRSGTASCGASSATRASRSHRCRSSGSEWRSWLPSSTGFHGRATRCTDSRSACTRPTSRRYRAASSAADEKPSPGQCSGMAPDDAAAGTLPDR